MSFYQSPILLPSLVVFGVSMYVTHVSVTGVPQEFPKMGHLVVLPHPTFYFVVPGIRQHWSTVVGHNMPKCHGRKMWP